MHFWMAIAFASLLYCVLVLMALSVLSFGTAVGTFVVKNGGDEVGWSYVKSLRVVASRVDRETEKER